LSAPALLPATEDTDQHLWQREKKDSWPRSVTTVTRLSPFFYSAANKLTYHEVDNTDPSTVKHRKVHLGEKGVSGGVCEKKVSLKSH